MMSLNNTRGALSQVAQAECLAGEVTHQDRHHAEQLFLCVGVRLYYVGNAQSGNKNQSFCTQG